jgi:hypothetical protein
MQVINDNLNQLQHVKPDARLQRYNFLLQRSINAFLGGDFKGSLEDPVNIAAGSYRVPTPGGRRLADVAYQVNTRAMRVYCPVGGR